MINILLNSFFPFFFLYLLFKKVKLTYLVSFGFYTEDLILSDRMLVSVYFYPYKISFKEAFIFLLYYLFCFFTGDIEFEILELFND